MDFTRHRTPFLPCLIEPLMPFISSPSVALSDAFLSQTGRKTAGDIVKRLERRSPILVNKTQPFWQDLSVSSYRLIEGEVMAC
jgi:hypothetical protein